MAIYHQILWLQASPKFTSVPAMVRISVMWTLGSGIELNHLNTKKNSIFSCSFPLPKTESHDCAVAGPHRCCHSQGRAHRQVSRILGCTLCSQIIFGKQRSKRQLGRLLERFAGGRAGTAHAGTQQQLLSRTLSEEVSEVTLQTQPLLHTQPSCLTPLCSGLTFQVGIAQCCDCSSSSTISKSLQHCPERQRSSTTPVTQCQPTITGPLPFSMPTFLQE